jgi:hypothetical protein
MMAKVKDKTGTDAGGAGRLQQAARVALAREARTASPDGEWSDGVWLPSAQERRPCCEGIAPSPANRQALESHCRTQRHVAQLFEVPLEELKREVRRARGGPGGRAAEVRDGSALLELVRVSAEARGQARRELREALSGFEENAPVFLQEMDEAVAAAAQSGSDADLCQLLDRMIADLERLKALVEFNRSVESAYQSARSVQDALENLRGLRKESAA